MSLALELGRDRRSELERIWAERQASGQQRPPMTLPPAVEPEPEPDPEPEPKPPEAPKGWARTPKAAAERRAAFLAAVKAKFAEGGVVTVADAAAAGGVHHVTAGDYITQLRKRGEWPFAMGKRGGLRTPKPKAAVEPKPEPKRTEPKSATPTCRACGGNLLPNVACLVCSRSGRLAAPEDANAAPPPVVVEAEAAPAAPPDGPAPVEAIEAWGLNYHVGSAVEHLAGGGLEGVKKARWHLEREIARIEGRAG